MRCNEDGGFISQNQYTNCSRYRSVWTLQKLSRTDTYLHLITPTECYVGIANGVDPDVVDTQSCADAPLSLIQLIWWYRLSPPISNIFPLATVAIISLSYITYLLLMLFFYDIPSLCYNYLIYCHPCIFSPLRRCAISSSTTEVSSFTLLLRIRYLAYITL